VDDVDDTLDGLDFVYTTPSHQCPTTVTMPLARREALLARAEAQDFIVIEDDYESENRFEGEPTPALKSLDRAGRVVYVGSLSKTLAPGLRIGYIVAPAPLAAELRALRRLMLRHPATYLQRAFALFLSLGHHDALLRRLAVTQRERAALLLDALARHLPDCEVAPLSGGASLWLRLPPGTDARALEQRARAQGVLVEPGDVFFLSEPAPAAYIRLGFSATPTAAIEPGIRELARVLHAP
jgi:GntR family transcriptional regulator / MocR family aminotransferase